MHLYSVSDHVRGQTSLFCLISNFRRPYSIRTRSEAETKKQEMSCCPAVSFLSLLYFFRLDFLLNPKQMGGKKRRGKRENPRRGAYFLLLII